MEFIIVVLLVIVIASLPLYKKHKTNASEAELPQAQEQLTQELRSRVETFLDRDLFSLVIQPVVDFRTNRATTGEVLSRLNHPERGVVFPNEFLPVIDALDLYPKFDRYIFHKCCAWLRRSRDQGEAFDGLSCNFSRKTLSQPDLVPDLIRIADDYGIPHSALALEITDQEREPDARQMIRNLQQLKAAGFRIILDDFGDGVTSIKDLMQYPLDIVKIDRSILLHTRTEQEQKVFCAMVEMATQLGAEVVCEGIETQEQSRFAREAGCHYGQGFLFFRPVSQDQVLEEIAKSSILEENV